MAIYSQRYKYIYFANPLTASKATAKTLREKVDGKLLVASAGPAAEKPPHHMSWLEVQEHQLLSREQLEGLLKVTNVRNPYDFLVSRYIKHRDSFAKDPEKYGWMAQEERLRTSIQVAREQDFPQWLSTQYQHHADKGKTVNNRDKYLDHADLILRFESLQADFNEFMKRIGIKETVELVSHNVTKERAAGEEGKKKHYSTFYDEPSRQLVAKIYAPLIERFGYRFD